MIQKKLQKNIVPLFVAVILAVNPLALCASASVWEGSVTLRVDYWGAGNGVHYQMSSSPYTIPISSTYMMIGPKQDQIVNGLYFYEDEQTWTSDVDVYIGGYFQSPYSGDSIKMYGDPYDSANYEVTYRGTEGTAGEVISGSLIELTGFNPSTTLPHGQGISMRAGWAASEDSPISELRIRPSVMSGWQKIKGGTTNYNSEWIITSVRLITAESSAELDELSNVADQIIAGNEILEAMKGDVVALLQDIYIVCGDINIAADRLTELLNALVGYVDGLEGKVDDVNDNLLDTYRLMSGFFTQISKLIKDNHDALVKVLNSNHVEMLSWLEAMYRVILGNGDFGVDANEEIGYGEEVQMGLSELDKIDPDAAVDNLYTPNGETEEFASVLSSFFNNSLVMTMLMVSLSMSFVAYVLYGKR